MNIYRIAKASTIINCAIVMFIMPSVLFIATDASVFLSTLLLSIYLFILLIATVLFNNHYTYALGSDSMKYFRSLPNAYKTFKSYSIKNDLILFLIGFSALIPIIFPAALGRSIFVAIFAGYMLLIGISRFIYAFSKNINNKIGVIIGIITGAQMGVLVCNIALFTTDTIPDLGIEASLTICAVLTVFALAAIILNISRLEKHWNAD